MRHAASDGDTVPERDLVLERSTGSDRSDARLRRFAAFVTMPASLALLLDEPGLVRGAIAVGGILASGFWLRSARRALAGAPAILGTLTLRAQGLRLDDEHGTREVAYGAIADLDLDDSASVLLVRMRDEPPLRIEPGYGELGVVELARLVRARVEGGIPGRGGYHARNAEEA